MSFVLYLLIVAARPGHSGDDLRLLEQTRYATMQECEQALVGIRFATAYPETRFSSAESQWIDVALPVTAAWCAPEQASESACAKADQDGDGSVGLVDLTAVQTLLGQTCEAPR